MAWSTIRRATEEDHSRLAAAAVRFAARHALDLFDSSVMTLELALETRGDELPDAGEKAYLRKLWKGCTHRALGVRCDGIACGYVGNSID